MADRNFNSDPYYDDFDDSKGFQQILFKPGVSVQARELTQLQSILRDQIKKFGSHVFQQGSIVIPGNSFSDLSVSYLKLDQFFAGSPVDVSRFVGKTIVGQTTGVEAIVRHVEEITTTDPNTLFVNYSSAGTNGEAVFADGEEVYAKDNISIRAKLNDVNSMGFGSMAFINDGVYFVNGSFAKVARQSVVMSKYSNEPSCHVLLRIVEEIVTSDEDETLLDPAQGSPNFAAPGADRFKLSLVLTTLPLGSEISEDYIEIMRYDAGVLLVHAKTPKYSELEKSLAIRTYDESGDYVVTGFKGSIQEHIKLQKTKGVFPPPYGSRNKFVLDISPGKAYIKGFGVERIANTRFELDKARTADHIKNAQSSILTSFGQCIFISDLKFMPDFPTHEKIELFNDDDPGNLAATKVGEARTVSIEYSDAPGIYNLYVYDLTFESGFDIEDVGGIRFNLNGSATVLQKLLVPNATGTYTVGEVVEFNNKRATVEFHDPANSTLYVYKHDNTSESLKIGDSVIGLTSNVTSILKDKRVVQSKGLNEAPIIPLALRPATSLRNTLDECNIEYKVYKTVQIITDGSGSGSVVITDGTLDQVSPGTVIASSAFGMLSHTLFSVSSDGVTLSIVGGPASSTIKVQVLVNKKQLEERTKSLITNVEAGFTLSTIDNKKMFVLEKADIYELVSVVSTVDGDVTERFILDNGQRNYFYDFGTLTLSGIEPTGTLTVTYKYFEHSPGGDYFTVDSYRNSGIGDPGQLDFLDNIPQYFSTTLSRYYDLKSMIDFRKILTMSGDLVLNNSRIATSINYYVPRIDRFSINKSGNIEYQRGVPAAEPVAPVPPDDSLLLGTFTVPAWTPRISGVLIKEEKNRRFTMKDINALSERVGALEYYSTLNQTESNLINYDIVDAATGLSRFKTGYLVDNFRNPFTIADTLNPKFACTYENMVLNPAKEWIQANFTLLNSSTNMAMSSKVITLPYTEKVFARQPFSSKITNVNPFLVFAWVGVMDLTPNVDSWVETEDLPTIFREVTNTVVVRREEIVRVPVPAPIPAPVVPWVPPPEEDPISPPAPVPAPPPAPVPPPPVIVPPVPAPPPPPAPMQSPPAWENDGGWNGAEIGGNGFGTGDGGSVGADGGNGNGPGGNNGGASVGDGFGGGDGGGGGGGGDCFTPETMISMFGSADKAIKDVVVGDFVRSALDPTIGNKVLFIEVVDSTNWDYLYSLSKEEKPFATINHPLFIQGVLTSASIEASNETYPWLNIQSEFEFIRKIKTKKGTKVYNLWVDGDNTYMANGYGTHSIIEDGVVVLDLFNKGLITNEEALAATNHFTKKGSNLSMGAFSIGRIAHKMQNLGPVTSVVNSMLVKLIKDISYGNETRYSKAMELVMTSVGYVANKFGLGKRK